MFHAFKCTLVLLVRAKHLRCHRHSEWVSLSTTKTALVIIQCLVEAVLTDIMERALLDSRPARAKLDRLFGADITRVGLFSVHVGKDGLSLVIRHLHDVHSLFHVPFELADPVFVDFAKNDAKDCFGPFRNVLWHRKVSTLNIFREITEAARSNADSPVALRAHLICVEQDAALLVDENHVADVNDEQRERGIFRIGEDEHVIKRLYNCTPA